MTLTFAIDIRCHGQRKIHFPGELILLSYRIYDLGVISEWPYTMSW